MKNKPIIPYYFNKWIRKNMTGPEKIKEATETVNDIKQTIQEKYDKVMGKIAEYQSEIQRVLSEASYHSQKWINDKIGTIKSKIEKLTNDAKKWMEEQLQKAQNWLAEVQKDIENFIKELLASMILAIAGV